MANTQKALVKACITNIEVLDTMLKSKNIDEENIRKLSDAIAFLGHASFDLSIKRREMLKGSLSKEFQVICTAQIPVTSFLFGDDLNKTLKEIREVNKIKATSTFSQEQNYGHGYNSNKRHFLDKRQNSSYEKYRNYRSNRGKGY
ncbi:hypothetical protein SNE40_001500 [Patella caerulea]|uniref:Uncharacterized protein n=1 Tax=Patella caerulea TaxID=87958 RepID=A0AAN8KJG4_PATCE